MGFCPVGFCPVGFCPVGFCPDTVQKCSLGVGLPSATNVELVTTLLGSAFQATIVWGKKEHLK